MKISKVGHYLISRVARRPMLGRRFGVNRRHKLNYPLRERHRLTLAKNGGPAFYFLVLAFFFEPLLFV